MKLRNSESLEHRAYAPSLARMAAGDDQGKRTLTGYAVVWQSLSVVMDEGSGPFQERVLPGAFTESLQGIDLWMLGFHDSTIPLGRRAVDGSCETLKAVEDDYGLRILNYVPASPNGDNVYVAVQRGDLIGMSFGFNIVEERWLEENGVRIREIVKADIHEVSVVVWAAYEASHVKARSSVAPPKRHDKKTLQARQQHAEFLNDRTRYLLND